MELLVLLAILICPLVMAATMIWMTRSMRAGRGDGRGGKEDQ